MDGCVWNWDLPTQFRHGFGEMMICHWGSTIFRLTRFATVPGFLRISEESWSVQKFASEIWQSSSQEKTTQTKQEKQTCGLDTINFTICFFPIFYGSFWSRILKNFSYSGCLYNSTACSRLKFTHGWGCLKCFLQMAGFPVIFTIFSQY